jgi:hypothetical protein
MSLNVLIGEGGNQVPNTCQSQLPVFLPFLLSIPIKAALESASYRPSLNSSRPRRAPQKPPLESPSESPFRDPSPRLLTIASPVLPICLGTTPLLLLGRWPRSVAFLRITRSCRRLDLVTALTVA